MSRCPDFDNFLDTLPRLVISTTDNNTDIDPVFNGINLHEVKDRAESICAEMKSVFEAKDADYAQNGKPLGNLRSSTRQGIQPWKGVLIRMGDKKQRIGSFVARGRLMVASETVTDTLVDLANYSGLGRVLFLEAYPVPNPEIQDPLAAYTELSTWAIRAKILNDIESDLGLAVNDWREVCWPQIENSYDKLCDFAESTLR